MKPEVSSKCKKEKNDVIKITTIKERFSPKNQIEVFDSVQQQKMQLRQQINNAQMQVAKLEEQESSLLEQSKKDLKYFNLELARISLKAKFKVLLDHKRGQLLQQSFEKTPRINDYLEDKELYEKILFTGFLKEISTDPEILEAIPASIVNETVGRTSDALVKRSDVIKEIKKLIG